MKRLAALTLIVVLCVAAAGAASPPSRLITVTPRTVRLGSTLTIAFVTPAAASVRGYHVRLRAVNSGDPYISCLAALDFFNPKRVAAHSHIRFAYTPTRSQGLCPGAWRVDVVRAGARVLFGAGFTLR